MNIKYTAPLLDYSGYGECSRHYLGSLISAGVEVTCRIPRYTKESTDYGDLGTAARSLENRDLSYHVNLIHTTPDQFPKYREDGKYNIGQVFWETDKLPPQFADGCESLDEIWTGSEYNAGAIRKAGVDKPIHIIPEAIDVNLNVDEIVPYKSKAEGYKFYSIFEWTERKNPDALLRAYWREFTKEDNVSLVIKTYLDDFSVSKRREISLAIGAIKSALKQDYYAPVYIYRDLMLRSQMYRFHKSFDCFVSAHRGEGWGIPQMEAMLVGNPIISTNLGGIHEYLTQDSAVLVPSKMVPVQNTRNTQWYLPDQNWGEVNSEALQKAFRTAYENQETAKLVGKVGQDLVNKEFSFEAVGQKMLERLRQV